MISKDNLDQIKNYILKENGRLNIFLKINFDFLEKDLERLEQLEEENKRLKQDLSRLEKLETINKYYATQYYELQQSYLNLVTEHAKLENAIRLLKDKLIISVGRNDANYVECWRQFSLLLKADHDLLKEVLCND